MAKNRNKKKRNASVAMDITEQSVSCLPQAMDISETGVQKPGTGAPKISVKKGRPMKRSQNVRKMKSLEKAISKHEKIAEKVTKNENKKSRTQSAKLFTPVLATLLGYVATSKDPFIGVAYFCRTHATGYIAPLLLAASFAGALQSLLSFHKISAWINPASGALLLGVGLYTFLDG